MVDAVMGVFSLIKTVQDAALTVKSNRKASHKLSTRLKDLSPILQVRREPLFFKFS